MLFQGNIYSEAALVVVDSVLQDPGEKSLVPHEVSAFRKLRDGDLGERGNPFH